MAVSWGTIKSLLLFFGPIVLPKAIAYYRSVRAAPAIQGVSIRPVPLNVAKALLLLFVTAVAFIINSLPFSSPENIFNLTSSRLQIPTDVLFTRLSALRPHGLTAADSLLRNKINSLESRLLFFQYGPDVIRDCQFCKAEDPKSYLYYALPGILAPHLYNLCMLATTTSGLFIGKDAAIWRKTATIASIAVAATEFYFWGSYNHQANARATRLEDIDAFFWKMRVYRCLALAAVDGIIGWMLYLSSTNRAFLNPPSAAERVETSIRALDRVRNSVNSAAVLRNTINRDEELRLRSLSYWVDEGRLMGATMDEREVLEGVQNALEERINMTDISRDAENYAKTVVGHHLMGEI
ncbi:hypothetical protein B0O99DRAFT_605785 [Bisporella sp. PMI_857]|nr:hypothetical protein B0O99DRAFT_605785 [Bisporella sp. PMI_857]